MLKFTEQPKTLGMTSQKSIAFPEGNKLFAGDFHANLDETNTDMAQFSKRCNLKWIVQHQEYFCRKFAATNISSAPKQSKSSRLVSQVHMMAGQNVKK